MSNVKGYVISGFDGKLLRPADKTWTDPYNELGTIRHLGNWVLTSKEIDREIRADAAWISLALRIAPATFQAARGTTIIPAGSMRFDHYRHWRLRKIVRATMAGPQPPFIQ